MGRVGEKAFEQRAGELIGENRLLHDAIQPLLDVREIVCGKIAGLTREVMTLAQQNDESRRLMTVPGVGPMTVAPAARDIGIEPNPKQRIE